MSVHSLPGRAVPRCLILLSLGWMSGGVASLARDSKAEYVVVSASGATEAETYAARELADYLGKITGATIPVVAENKATIAPHKLFVGWTDFAAQHKVEAAQLGEEEWVIRTVESDLVIVGGRPRGTLYGVYAFLERELGCHWLDHNTEVVPRIPKLRLEKLDRRGKPAFWYRSIYTTFQTDRALQAALSARNMANSPSPGGLTAKHGFAVGYGSPGSCHTFAAYAQNFPADRPEYLSMNKQGKRVGAKDGSGPGGICLMSSRGTQARAGQPQGIHRQGPPERGQGQPAAAACLRYQSERQPLDVPVPRLQSYEPT